MIVISRIQLIIHHIKQYYMANRKEIRNSTAEFLIFQIEGKEQSVEVYYKDKTIWCTQKCYGYAV